MTADTAAAPTIGFVSLGCPKALTDSELILTQLSAEGYQTSKTYQGADLVIVNTAATLCHMSGGQFPVPVVIRMATGAGRQLAAQHSHSLEAWYAHVPGLRVVEPATIDDARGMLRAALACPDPVIVFEPISLYNMEGELTAAAAHVQLDGARVHRAGRDVTLVTYGASVWRCVAAAETLAAGGIDAEIVDLRSLRPLDDATILASVRKTRRVVIVDEGWRTASLAADKTKKS